MAEVKKVWNERLFRSMAVDRRSSRELKVVASPEEQESAVGKGWVRDTGFPCFPCGTICVSNYRYMIPLLTDENK